MKFNILCVGMLSMFLAGCGSLGLTAYRPGDQIKVVSFTKKPPVNGESLGELTGESCQTKILGIIPIGSEPEEAGALRDLKTQGANYLNDVRIDYPRESNWGLWSTKCIAMKGEAYK